jgi:hypothetical protein
VTVVRKGSCDIDRARVTSPSGQNLRMTPPRMRLVAVDEDVSPAGLSLEALAYGAVFRINLATGAATLVGPLSTGQMVRGFAIAL